MSEAFRTLDSAAIPLMRDNVDTDAIIPSREMRTVSKQGLAEGLFAGWRYLAIGGREPDGRFVLNDPRRRGARILLAGWNFGCGSSREHAVWALAEFGFRAIIAKSFNPIFFNNCIANGILPVVLPGEVVDEIADVVEKSPQTHLRVDLIEQDVSIHGAGRWSFGIEFEARQGLIEGLDAIAQTLKIKDVIEQFREADRSARPWIYSPVVTARTATSR